MNLNGTASPESPPAYFALASDEVRLWSLDVIAAEDMLAACEALLSGAEKERMLRMRAGVARQEFVVGRACLRVLLGLALRVDPHGVDIVPGADGKPRVDGIEFSVAHSHGQVLIALCRSARIGVDIERVDASIEAVEIAADNFTPLERQRVEAAALRYGRAREFFRIWARKEAIVKAHGGGLLLPLAKIETSGGAGESAVELTDAQGVTSYYYVGDLEAASGFASALASERSGLRVQVERLSESGLRSLLTCV